MFSQDQSFLIIKFFIKTNVLKILKNYYSDYIWEYLQNILVIHQLNVDWLKFFFSFLNICDSQDTGAREGYFPKSSLLLPPASDT